MTTEAIGQTRARARTARYLWLLFDTRDWYDGELFTSYRAAKQECDAYNRFAGGVFWRVRKYIVQGKAKP